MTKVKKPDSDNRDFSVILEEGLREIITKSGVDPELKLNAIKIGADLMLKQHRIGGNDEKGSFFKPKPGEKYNV
jgi:hypothetical protein